MTIQYTCCAITLVNIGQSESQALLDALCVDNFAGVIMPTYTVYCWSRGWLSIHQERLGRGRPPLTLHSSSRLVSSLTWSQVSPGSLMMTGLTTEITGTGGRRVTASLLLSKVV